MVPRAGGAGGVGAGEVRHNHLALLLDSVGGNCAAEENQLIIRVRGEEEDIRLLFRRLPPSQANRPQKAQTGR